MLESETQNMLDVLHTLTFLMQFRYLWARRRASFFARAAAVANRGPIVHKSAGHKRHHPVGSSTRVVLGQRRGVGQWVDEDVKVWKAVGLDHCL